MFIGSTRRYLGLSQLEVAQSIGIGRPSVSQTETGARLMGVLEIRKWAELFGVPINYFISDPPGVVCQAEQTKYTKDLPDEEVGKVVSYAHYLRMNSTNAAVNKRTVIEEERQKIIHEIGAERVLQLELRYLDDQAKIELGDFADYRRSKVNLPTLS